MKSIPHLRLILGLFCVAFTAHNIVADEQIASGAKAQNPFEKNVTPQQLLSDIQHDLNDPEYPELLANNFGHLIELLRYGHQTGQPRLFAESTIGLFSKKLKQCTYINGYLFADLLHQMQPLLQPYFIPPKAYGTAKLQLDIDMIDRFQQTINSLMVSRFNTEWGSFRENPKTFLDHLATNIAKAAQEEVGIFQLRQALIKFIEVGLNKLIWNPNDEIRSWHETKKITQELAACMDKGIFDDINELDELYWSVTTRFAYFVQTMGTDLPLSFYQKIKHDLETEPQLLAQIDEQESFMETKLDYLKRTLVTSEAKKVAFDQAGIIAS